MTPARAPILLAAGGTGGHVAPAIALADELIARGYPVILATDQRGLRYAAPRAGMTIHVIKAGTLRKNPIRLVKDMLALVIGLFQSFDILRDHRPAVVVGFGGYPCFPPVITAQMLGIPTLLHQSDAVVGQANLMLARFCDRLALSLPDYSGLPEKIRARTIVTGRPSAAAIDALYDRPYTPSQNIDPFNIVILGGSQGAHILSDDVPRAFCQIEPALRARLRLTHQVLAPDVDQAKKMYADAGITADIAPFFNDIPARLATAHLFIGRSGGTVHEISIAGIPALYIPYPHHRDQQQFKNAAVIERAGGALILKEADFTAQSFLAPIQQLMQDPLLSAKMAVAAKSCGHPKAAQKLADVALDLAKAI